MSLTVISFSTFLITVYVILQPASMSVMVGGISSEKPVEEGEVKDMIVGVSLI